MANVVEQVTRNLRAPLRPPRHLLKQLGEMGHALWHVKRTGTVSKVLDENTGVGGGYLVPEELHVGIDEALEERCLFHRLAFQQPMGSEQTDLGAFNIAAAHATGASPLFGGMYFQWGKQGLSIPENDPTFAQNALVAKNLQGVVTVSNQLVQDGGEALGAYLFNGFERCVRFGVEQACFIGPGAPGNTGQPQGITTAPGTVQVTAGANGTIAITDLETMLSSLLPASFPNAVWACSVGAIKQIMGLASFVVNQGLSQGGILAGFLLGRPLYVTEHLPAPGKQGSVVLFDPTLYVLGTRSLEIAFSDQVLFQTYQSMYRTIWRGDGQPRVLNTFLLQDGATTVGVYVCLT